MPSSVNDADAGPPRGEGPAGALTVLLNAASAGDSEALARVLGVVYDELRLIANSRMGQERPGHTLQATALVNEAYLRLLGREGVQFEGRGHFFRAAAEAMRHILIDHARKRSAIKRGGGEDAPVRPSGRAALRLSGVANLGALEDPSGMLALDATILRLEEVDPQAAAVVRLRFYAGLPEVAIGEALGISERTVRREWAFARGWLRDALEKMDR